MPLPAWDAEDVDESGGQGNHGGRKAQLTLWWTCIVQGIMILSISRGKDCNQIKVAEIDGRHDLSRRFQHASMLMVTTS